MFQRITLASSRNTLTPSTSCGSSGWSPRAETGAVYELSSGSIEDMSRIASPGVSRAITIPGGHDRAADVVGAQREVDLLRREEDTEESGQFGQHGDRGELRPGDVPPHLMAGRTVSGRNRLRLAGMLVPVFTLRLRPCVLLLLRAGCHQAVLHVPRDHPDVDRVTGSEAPTITPSDMTAQKSGSVGSITRMSRPIISRA